MTKPMQVRHSIGALRASAHGAMGRMHAAAVGLRSNTSGQGTVEYVALILLVGAVLAGVVAATKGKQFGASGIAESIVKQLRKAVDAVH